MGKLKELYEDIKKEIWDAADVSQYILSEIRTAILDAYYVIMDSGFLYTYEEYCPNLTEKNIRFMLLSGTSRFVPFYYSEELDKPFLLYSKLMMKTSTHKLIEENFSNCFNNESIKEVFPYRHFTHTAEELGLSMDFLKDVPINYNRRRMVKYFSENTCMWGMIITLTTTDHGKLEELYLSKVDWDVEKSTYKHNILTKDNLIFKKICESKDVPEELLTQLFRPIYLDKSEIPDIEEKILELAESNSKNMCMKLINQFYKSVNGSSLKKINFILKKYDL